MVKAFVGLRFGVVGVRGWGLGFIGALYGPCKGPKRAA